MDTLDPDVADTALSFMPANLRADLRADLRGQAFGPEQPAPPDAGPYALLAASAGRGTR